MASLLPFTLLCFSAYVKRIHKAETDQLDTHARTHGTKFFNGEYVRVAFSFLNQSNMFFYKRFFVFFRRKLQGSLKAYK